jgi:hypothetical protein
MILCQPILDFYPGVLHYRCMSLDKLKYIQYLNIRRKQALTRQLFKNGLFITDTNPGAADGTEHSLISILTWTLILLNIMKR